METKPTEQKNSLEDVLKTNGFIIWNVSGVSMLPLIREGRDLVILRRIEEEPRDFDVVAYKKGNQREEKYDRQHYVLHRLIRKDGDTYIILGDNCVGLEYVPKDRVIGVMEGIIRDGERLNTDSLKYKMYNVIWAKPWKARIRILRLRNRLRRAWWKGVEITSPYTPRPVKEAVKKIVIPNK